MGALAERSAAASILRDARSHQSLTRRMSTQPIRVAIAGYGLAGRFFHGPLLRALPGFAVTTVVTRDATRRAQALTDFSSVTVVDTVDDIFRAPDDHDLVVIATRTGTHAALALQAVEARVAAVIEKPMATNAADARRVADSARRANVKLFPFHNRRWDSEVLTLRGLIAEGSLGAMHRFESRFERWRPELDLTAWRDRQSSVADGGVLLDLGVHIVDQALMLFGSASVTHAEIAARRGGADDDVFIALQHQSGVTSHLRASAVCGAPGPRLRVLGSAAAYIHPDLDPQEDALRGGRSPTAAGFGTAPRRQWGALARGDERRPVRPVPGRWLAFYEGVAATLRDGAPPPVAPEDAVAALSILDDARRLAPRERVLPGEP